MLVLPDNKTKQAGREFFTEFYFISIHSHSFSTPGDLRSTRPSNIPPCHARACSVEPLPTLGPRALVVCCE
jgi:hypothetical protein